MCKIISNWSGNRDGWKEIPSTIEKVWWRYTGRVDVQLCIHHDDHVWYVWFKKVQVDSEQGIQRCESKRQSLLWANSMSMSNDKPYSVFVDYLSIYTCNQMTRSNWLWKWVEKIDIKPYNNLPKYVYLCVCSWMICPRAQP